MAGKESVQEQVKTVVKTRTNSFIRYLPNILINLFSVIILALMTIVMFDFGFDYLATPQFYITTIALILIYTLSHWSTFDARIKKKRSEKAHEEYMEKQNYELKKIVDTLEWLRNRFIFISFRNTEKKIEAWKTHISNKLTKMNNKARKKDLAIESATITEYQRKNVPESELEAIQQRYDTARLNNRYCNKKRLYEEKMRDTWIAQNIDKITIEYDEIDIQFVETGNIIKGIKKSRVKSKGKYAKDNASQRLIATILTVFISAFGVQLILDGFNAEALIIFFLRSLLLAMNMLMGLDYAEQFYREIDLYNIDSRVSITKEFKEYGLNNGIYEVKK